MSTITAFRDFLFAKGLISNLKFAEKGEQLQEIYTKGKYLFLIQSGAVRAFTINEDEKLTIRLGYSGSLITAIDSLISGNKSDMGIEALRKVSYFRVKYDSIQKIKMEDEGRKLWIDAMESLALQQFERELDLLTSKPEERLKRLLNRSPKVFQEVPNKYIASYLRMTPETLSRLLKKHS